MINREKIIIFCLLLVNTFVNAADQFVNLGYININKIHPGQLRYASKNVDQKVAEAIKKGNATKKNGTYTLKHHDGRSIMAKHSPLPVIYSRDVGYVLLDGHHDVLASIAVGATTVPVKEIVPDQQKIITAVQKVIPTDKQKRILNALEQKYKQLQEITTNGVIDEQKFDKKFSPFVDIDAKDFWKIGESLGYVYPYGVPDLGNERVRSIPPKSFVNEAGTVILQDDPNRYAAAIFARKCFFSDETKKWNCIGADYPIWIKCGKDIPFIEFMIADKMYKNNVNYNYGMGEQLPEEFVEKVRKTLLNDPISGLKIVSERKTAADIEKEGIEKICK